MCDCVCGGVGGWVRGHHSNLDAWEESKRGLTLFTFSFKWPLCSLSTHHMTPGHSLLIMAVLDPPLPPSQRHTHTHTHTDNHALRHTQWVACYSQRVYRKPPLQIGVDWKGLKSRCWQGPVWVPRWPENLINTGHWYQTHFLSLYLSMWWTTESMVKLNDALSLTFSGKTLYNWRFIRGQLNQSQL